MWYRHGIDSWHLECSVTADGHDYIASITKKDGKLELVISPSHTKVFESNEALNAHLRILGLEEIGLP